MIFRSQSKPIKRVILHKDFDESQKLIVGDKDANQAFTETQIVRAMIGPNKLISRSVSPTNYDNGYGPQTIRIFANNKPVKRLQNNQMTMIKGRLMDKDNIFTSLAKKERFKYRPYEGARLSASVE